MDVDFFQVAVLAVIQGITEFLPISSSGHLILPSMVLGWPDQGLTFDVAVHVGTLLAVVYYYRSDVIELLQAWFRSLVARRSTPQSRLAWLIILATIPAGLAGILVDDYVEQYARALPVIATTSLVFALLLFWSEKSSSSETSISSLSWKQAAFIGFAQALALIPGTSRSGATMTAALFCNMPKGDAAKFSFLLSMPIIFASGLLKTSQLVSATESSVDWLQLLIGLVISGLVALACIHWFLALIEKMGFLPFVVYRIILAFALGLFYLL